MIDLLQTITLILLGAASLVQGVTIGRMLREKDRL